MSLKGPEREIMNKELRTESEKCEVERLFKRKTEIILTWLILTEATAGKELSKGMGQDQSENDI